MGAGAEAGWNGGAAVRERRGKLNERAGHLAFAIGVLIVVVVAPLMGCAKRDRTYPSKAISIVCPWKQGGGTDRLARFMADQLQIKLGVPVVVENRIGGSGAVGFAAGANAAPDGYTITMATFELSTMHWIGISKLTYEDFTPLVQLNGDAAAIIVPKNGRFSSLPELLKFVRENPGKLKMSGTAKGAAWDLARSGLLMADGLPVDSVVWVPADGAAPAIVELLGGHIDAVCCSVPEALSQIESGQLAALAVTSPERLEEFPNIPTCKELGVQWEAVGWRGLALPKGAPANVVSKLEDVSLEIAQSDAFRNFMKKNGFAASVRGPEGFKEFLREQDERWHKVIIGSAVGAASISAGAGSSDPGPWAVPIGVSAFILGALGYQLFRRGKRAAPASSTGGPAFSKALAGWVMAFAVYLAVMPWIGFFVASGLLTLLVIRSQGRGWLSAAISSLVLMAAVYLLFVRLFRVPLPVGALF